MSSHQPNQTDQPKRDSQISDRAKKVYKEGWNIDISTLDPAIDLRPARSGAVGLVVPPADGFFHYVGKWVCGLHKLDNPQEACSMIMPNTKKGISNHLSKYHKHDSALRRHNKPYPDGPRECAECHKKLLTPNSYRQHMYRHGYRSEKGKDKENYNTNTVQDQIEG